jgi:hypothetical protein
LKRVDPTLLENDDNLVLNVIVAALPGEPQVREALRDRQDGKMEFYDELQCLGSPLASIEKNGSEYELDRLQALVESYKLAEHVHMLFHRASGLTEKQLVAQPADEVDTSLEQPSITSKQRANT